MKIFNIKFLKNDKKILNNESFKLDIDNYCEIGKLVKEARVQKNLSIKELSYLSKIPESSIKAIENNIKHLRPKYPFIRSILLKLEECLSLRENTLLALSYKEKNTFNIDNKDLIIRKFDFLDSWQGTLLYFIGLIFILFIINRYFISNMHFIEFQIIEEKANKN